MPGRRAAQPLVIRRRDQVEALVSPVRQEIVDAVAAAGPSTIAQIAEWLGRRPDSLYYHIAALVEAGLLVEAGRRRTGRRFGAVYDVPGRPMSIRDEGSIGAGPVIKVVRAALRLADRDFRRALENGSAVMEGPARNVRGGRVKGWMDAKDLAEANELITRLSELVQRGGPRPGAAAQSFTFVLTPVATTGSRRSTGRSKAAGAAAARGNLKPGRRAAGDRE